MIIIFTITRYLFSLRVCYSKLSKQSEGLKSFANKDHIVISLINKLNRICSDNDRFDYNLIDAIICDNLDRWLTEHR